MWATRTSPSKVLGGEGVGSTEAVVADDSAWRVFGVTEPVAVRAGWLGVASKSNGGVPPPMRAVGIAWASQPLRCAASGGRVARSVDSCPVRTVIHLSGPPLGPPLSMARAPWPARRGVTHERHIRHRPTREHSVGIAAYRLHASTSCWARAWRSAQASRPCRNVSREDTNARARASGADWSPHCRRSM